MAGPYFTKSSFDFLKELKKNNNRDWFAGNKLRYEQKVKDPALRLIADFGPELLEISPHFQATPRSLFRIYRDTRFSKDKTPYKTATGIHFRHDRSKNAYAPGFYLHVEPGNCFAGLGIWHPEPKALRLIREHILEDPDGWRKASKSKRFRENFEFGGERLKRPPKGFDPEHPLIEDLKWKDFIGVKQLPQTFVTGRELPKELARTFRDGIPLVRFLCCALDVPF